LKARTERNSSSFLISSAGSASFASVWLDMMLRSVETTTKNVNEAMLLNFYEEQKKSVQIDLHVRVLLAFV
jgi:hypothetical protein